MAVSPTQAISVHRWEAVAQLGDGGEAGLWRRCWFLGGGGAAAGLRHAWGRVTDRATGGDPVRQNSYGPHLK